MENGMNCWKCGSQNLMRTPTYLEPLVRQTGDRLVFTVCQDCWQVNEFVNGKAVRIVFIGQQRRIKSSKVKKIKSVYRLQGDQVVAFDKEGQPLRQYTEFFEFVKDRVLKDVGANTEFFISTVGLGNFDRVTKEQWINYVRKEG